MTDEKVYTPAELAATVGISRAIVYQLIAREQLAVLRFGTARGRIRIEWSAWLAFKAAHRQPARVGEQMVEASPRPRSDVRDLPGASRYVS
ncbi:MAG TPA: hypothetical protein VEU08_17230 [Vicinamibacterales bacterium]|nr:hypothetical protein [Vicinamibacterales bacterium]